MVFKSRLAISTLIAATVALQGCNSIYGPVRPIQAGKLGGISSCPPKAKITTSSSNSPILERLFAEKACASLLATGDGKKEGDEEKAKQMFEAGVMLVHARCNDFFAQKAGTQVVTNTAFDSIAPVVALLTGILSITNFQNADRRKDYESALAFGSVAVVSGLKVYEENFLFGTDNIASVRNLTVSALDEQAQRVRSLKGEQTFYTAAKYVVQNQMICTPGEIRDRVKNAIEAKKITFTTRDVSTLAGIPADNIRETQDEGKVGDPLYEN